MSREWQLFWGDIIKACREVAEDVRGMDQGAFEADRKTRQAVLLNLLIIGEPSKQLPPEAKALVPGVDWRKIAGLRDIIAHAYFGLDYDTIWDTVEVKVPELLAAMQDVQLP